MDCLEVVFLLRLGGGVWNIGGRLDNGLVVSELVVVDVEQNSRHLWLPSSTELFKLTAHHFPPGMSGVLAQSL